MVRELSSKMSAREACEWLMDVLTSGDPLRHDQLLRFEADNPGWVDRYSEDEQYQIRAILSDIASYSMAGRSR